jgi:predicted enzyme related to lactoylglutathione lyase
MTDELVPVLRIKDGQRSMPWYARLGFEVEGEHRFSPDLPLYAFLRRGNARLHLSEHRGDAPKKGLVYFYVQDLEAIAAEFGQTIEHAPWGLEVHLVDPDGNRIRCGRLHESSEENDQ